MDELMSNYDHSIESNAEETLKGSLCYGTYSAWNFGAIIWYEENKFLAFVLSYRKHQGTFSYPSLQAMMDDLCERFGDE